MAYGSEAILMIRALFAAVVFSLFVATSAQALELGVHDDGRLRSHDPTTLFDDGHRIHAQWVRIVTGLGEPWTAQKIRDAHTAGFKVILTIGGNGTPTPHPSAAATLRWINQLPAADRYTWTNEADWVGPTPCLYRRGWMRLRRQLGHRLLWGDFSPIAPVRFTAAARACGPLPYHLDVAVHPYQPDDPLAPTSFSMWAEGAMGNLGHARRALQGMGIRVTWWLTEFGYGQKLGRAGDITDARAAWLWPRAIKRAEQLHAKVLVVYTAQGANWDTRPGEQAWTALRSAS